MLEGDESLRYSLGMQAAQRFVNEVLMYNFVGSDGSQFTEYKQLFPAGEMHRLLKPGMPENEQLVGIFNKSTRVSVEFSRAAGGYCVQVCMRFFTNSQKIAEVRVNFSFGKGLAAAFYFSIE